MVADWDVAVQNLRVCTERPVGALNCGRCENCVRTMLELLVVGKLHHAKILPTREISPELLQEVLDLEHLMYCTGEYGQLIEPLRTRGRPELAAVIQQRFRDLDDYLAWEREQDWKGTVKRFDRKYLGSHLFNSYRAMRRFFVKREFARPRS